MPDCEYCGATFDDEAAYRDHLDDAHADELGRIDGRRVEDHEGAHGEAEPDADDREDA